MIQLKVIGKQDVAGIHFTGIEGGFGENKKAMLVKDVAHIHGKEVRVINQNIERNRKRFKDGIDILDMKSAITQSDSEITEYGFTQNAWNASKSIYLLSERGYAKLLKILEDDTAWELYDKLVDCYFGMRQAIKEGTTENLKAKRLEIMNENAKTRQAQFLYKLSQQVDSDVQKQNLYAEAVEIITGKKLIPVLNRKEYSAQQVGDKLGISKNLVGKIANRVGIKAEMPNGNEYGYWSNPEVRGTNRATWVYFEKGFQAIEKEVEKI